MSKMAQQDSVLWVELVKDYVKFLNASKEFEDLTKKVLSQEVDYISLLRKALLSTGSEREAAVRLSRRLSTSDLMQLFPEFVFLASWSNSLVMSIRELIKSLPREWVLANIEKIAEPLLLKGDDEEYRRFLELYSELDRNLTLKLANRASKHTNEHISEAGKDFLEMLK